MIERRRPSEENDFGDFFDRFSTDYTDKMAEFKEK